jgi:uncharacterized membrane protein
MIGMQGIAGELGSLLTTFIAGQLLVFGWRTSFVVLLIVFFFIQNIKYTESAKEEVKEETYNAKAVWGWSLLSFLSVALVTFFVIKSSSLIASSQQASSADGSYMVMLISAGSLIAGLLMEKSMTR